MTQLPRTLSAALIGGVLIGGALPDRAYAFAEFARGPLLLETTLTGTYDSHFIGSPTYGDDFYATLRPMLNYSRSAGLAKLNASAGIAINRYVTNTRFDSEDFSASLRSSLPVAEGSRLTGGVSGSYSESTQIDQIVNDRVAVKGYVFNLGLSYITGVKTSLSESANYSRNERNIYGDQTIWSNALAFTYRDFLEDTNLTLSHDYVNTKSSGSDYAQWAFDPTQVTAFPDVPLDQESNSINLTLTRPVYGQIIGAFTYGYRVLDRSAAEVQQFDANGNPIGVTPASRTRDKGSVVSISLTGPLLPPARFPKVESSASLSYQQATSPGINDSGNETVTGSLKLAWNARERTRLSVGALRSLELGTNNFTVENTQVNAGITQSVGLSTSLSGNVSYTWRTYRGLDRDDATLEVNLSAQRPLIKNWNAAVNYIFQDVQTDSVGFQGTRFQLSDYTRHVVSFSISNVF